MAVSSQTTLHAVQTAFMAPVIAAFVVGSLPVLLPALAYRWWSRRSARRAVASTAQTQQPIRIEPQAAAETGFRRPTAAAVIRPGLTGATPNPV